MMKLCAAASVLALGMAHSNAAQLITAEEAALPQQPGAGVEMTTRGITRGPRVVVVSPARDADAVASPVNLKVKFETFGGSSIKTENVKVMYLRKPAVDLTSRVKSFVKEDGIEMSAAEVPPGTHAIKVDVVDSDGRAGSTVVTLKVK